MSSTMNLDATPPPPPRSVIQGSGQTQISLKEMFGSKMQRELSGTLNELGTNFSGFVQNELGLQPDSPEAARLRWQNKGEIAPGVREYSRTVNGSELPTELQAGTSSLNIRLVVGGGVLQVRHNYRTTVLQSSSQEVRQRVEAALDRAVARSVNPLIATTVSQTLKRKAEQKLQPRLKQGQRMKTTVGANLNHQTVGLIRAAYAG